jgi:uncharacterized membrane protein
MRVREFIKQIDEQKIVSAISEAEKSTSGEIRVVISKARVLDPLESARAEFFKLGMDKCRDRNAVLIFIAPAARQFAVWGDISVHEKCGNDFWSDIVCQMGSLLKDGKYTEAIVLAVRLVGEILRKHFPKKPDDINELPDEVVIRKATQGNK